LIRLDANPQAKPPDRKLAQVEQSVWGSKRHAMVTDVGGQATLLPALGQAGEVGSKMRRVYSPAQTPWEQVLASGQADTRRAAELKKLRSTLDPFALAESMDGKLESIYGLANRPLSPKAANLRGATPVEKTRRGKVQKTDFPPSLGNPAKGAGFPLSHSHYGGCSVTSLMSR
jgi:hypothetical protein